LLPTDFTDGETSFQFKFSDLAEEIADDDISIQHLQGQASQIYNGITISQPERPTPEDDVDYSDRTTQFAIYPSTAKHFLETQRTLGAEGMYNKWKLPVGLAVGLGVPVLMAISGIVGIFFGKRQRQSVLASKSSGTMEG
jgi:hypothetical protein